MANNAAAISSIVNDVSNNAAGVSNNAAAISSNDAEISSISNDLAEATRCTAADWKYSCCTSANPCSLGQGDCNSNDECGGTLTCGSNNCLNDFGFGDSGLDCCINDNEANIANNAAAISSNAAGISNNAAGISNNAAGISNNAASISSNDAEISIISNDVAEATRCTAADWSYSCCTTSNPCSLGKGDCNSDSECGGDLICGKNNCLREFGFGDSGLDCCIDGLRHHVSEGTQSLL